MRFTFAATLFALASSVLSAPLDTKASRYAGLARRNVEAEPTLAARGNCPTIPDKPDPEMLKIVYRTVKKRSDDYNIMLITFITAWRESHFHNLRCGDRQSLGLFQQQAMYGWGSNSSILDPEYSTNAFLNVLLKVYPKNKGKSPGTIAQIVQVAIAGNKYDENVPYGRQLIEQAKKLVGDNSSDNSGGNDKPPTTTTKSSGGDNGAINVGGKPPAKPTTTKTQDGPKQTPPPADDNKDDDGDDDKDDEDCECTKYYTPVRGDICYTVAAKFNLELKDFYELNPQIDANCQNLYAGQQYCVSTDPADATN